MAGFKFERELPHQMDAVKAVMGVLDGVSTNASPVAYERALRNPGLVIDGSQWVDNIMAVQARNGIDNANMVFRDNRKRILDVSMETGTGKTYTYTKTLFELNQHFGITKFIVVVPSLSIKAGTVNFLGSDAAREHFRQDYGMDMQVHVLESKKGNKKGKTFMPPAVTQFVQAGGVGKKEIDILVVNAGMLNSPTIEETFDVSLFEKYHTPMAALQSVNAITIVDEPHKFPITGKFWQSIEKLQSQLIIRYGATFNEQYFNLVYELTAVHAFNENLVKGVLAHIEGFQDGGKSAIVKLMDVDGKEAKFELHENNKKKPFVLVKGDSLNKVHAEMEGLLIERMNRSVVVLSNGLELNKGKSLNPYSFSMSLQYKLMRQAVAQHFELERDYLTRDVRIKPLTLFFIDDIQGYRAGSHEIGGDLKQEFEAMLKTEIEHRLSTETNRYYKDYLQKSLANLSLTHGGYFSKDNSEKDDKIAKEVEEILHDKEALLSLDNPRRFIFSKWTLREGWDNPNVFQICKLRSSGSSTSKLQEVGRGLRLPVNEHMSRVKEEQFDLHYYVDVSETNFVNDLVGEINEKSGAFNGVLTKLTPELIEAIVKAYSDDVVDEDALLEALDDAGIIKRNNDFKEGGFEKLKQTYPNAFMGGVNKNKIRVQGEERKATMREGRYDELKQLWETINQRVILEYNVKQESEFEGLLMAFFEQHKEDFEPTGVKTRNQRLGFKDGHAFYREEQSLETKILPVSSMAYKEFLLSLSESLTINITTLHKAFIKLRALNSGAIDINDYLSMNTIRLIKGRFSRFLLDNAISKVEVSYHKVCNQIHPTKFTDGKGHPLKQVRANDLGVQLDEKPPADEYLFAETFFDSPLEKQNILQSIDEVTVFTKIPKSSIRIPVAGGFTYSPDFAYVIKRKDGQKQLNLVVETKDKGKSDLFANEQKKIEHAQAFFNSLQSDVEVKFKQQYAGNEIKKVIQECFS